MIDDENTVTVYTTSNAVEEGDICEALEAACVNYVVRSLEDEAFDGLFSGGLHSRIEVLEQDVEQAREIIELVVGQSESSDEQKQSD